MRRRFRAGDKRACFCSYIRGFRVRARGVGLSIGRVGIVEFFRIIGSG